MSTGNWAKAIVALAALCGAVDLFGAARSQIVINSKASKKFIEYESSREPGAPIRYIMVKGKYFGGEYRDEELETYKFSELAESVATALKKQNYQVTFDAASADLVIMVSWGQSVVEVDESEDWAYDSIEEMQEAMVGSEEDASFWRPANYERIDENRSIKLMGFEEVFKETWGMSQTRVEMAASLKSERYFMIVAAFDAASFISGDEWEVQWTTRYSLDSKGISFGDAVVALNYAAADYFGKSNKGLNKTWVDNGKIKLGELEVVEELEE